MHKKNVILLYILISPSILNYVLFQLLKAGSPAH